MIMDDNHTSDLDIRLAEMQATIDRLSSELDSLRTESQSVDPEFPCVPQIVGEGGANVFRVGNTYRVWCPEAYGAAEGPPLPWRLEYVDNGSGVLKLHVVDCVVSTGGMTHVFSSGLMTPPENGMLVCDIIVALDNTLSFSFSVVSEEDFPLPEGGGAVAWTVEIEYSNLRVPLYLFEGGVARDFIHGVFCPFIYDRAMNPVVETEGGAS